MTTKLIRSAYGPKAPVHATAPGPDEPGAKQSFKKECDINQIMAKYQKTGLINHFNERKPHYGFAPALEFKNALELISAADEQFSALPSSARKKFSNDPAEFLKFCENPDNRSEMALLGLLDPDAITPDSPPAQPSDSASAPIPPSPAPPTPE